MTFKDKTCAVDRTQARVVYLGPEGTFTQDAANMLFPDGSSDLQPLPAIPDVLEQVHSGNSHYGIVPIENSVYGEVTTTMDLLVFEYSDLFVCGEVVIPVSFCAFRRPGDVSPVRTVVSHPHAIAQCRRFIAGLGASTMNANSTAQACKQVAESTDPGLLALASGTAGPLYGLRSTATEVEDVAGAATRFYLVGRDFPAPSGIDKTILVFVPKTQETGALDRILQCFSKQNINLVSIQSRPLRSHLGEYCFISAINGHLAELQTHSAVLEILGIGTAVKFLGSFPMWKGHIPAAPSESLRGVKYGVSAVGQWLISMK